MKRWAIPSDDRMLGKSSDILLKMDLRRKPKILATICYSNQFETQFVLSLFRFPFAMLRSNCIDWFWEPYWRGVRPAACAQTRPKPRPSGTISDYEQSSCFKSPSRSAPSIHSTRQKHTSAAFSNPNPSDIDVNRSGSDQRSEAARLSNSNPNRRNDWPQAFTTNLDCPYFASRFGTR